MTQDALEAGIAALTRDDAPRAEALFRAILAEHGHLPAAWQGLGRALHDQKRFAEAEAAFAQAERVDPVPALARYHRGLIRLMHGDLAAGWELFEERLAVPVFGHPTVPLPRWRGQDLTGRRLLILGEQGYGDVIQFARFVPQVAKLGGSVTLACVAPLGPLMRPFATRHGVALQSGGSIDATQFDYVASICSLAGILGASMNDLGRDVPYLAASQRRVNAVREQLPPATRRIGLCWAGRPSRPQHAERSIPVDRLAPLADLPGIAWIGLTRAVDHAATASEPPPFLAADLAPSFYDFSDTAAALAAVDLVVTIDTALAHLAGALGRPTLVMLPHVADWRWFLDRDDSPWYPGMHLFRQPIPGDWDPVVRAVAQTLASP